MLELLCNSLIVFWFGLPLIAWLFRLVGPNRIHALVLYVCAIVIGYFAFVGCAWAADAMLEQRMNSFDRDGDGGIGGDELTPEAEKAMDDWASDTGRSLAIFTGLPLTAIWAAICLIPLCVGEWIVRRLIARRDLEANPGDVRDRPPDDGNPYTSPGSC